jgi:serine/threonine protein kinase
MGALTNAVTTPVLPPDGPPVHARGHLIAPGYLLIEHIRRGEDVDSYEAWSVERFCRCFVKTLRPDRLQDRAAHHYLRREARLLLSLSHPHLVRGYEYLPQHGRQAPVLVCENLTGATLSYILEQECGRLGAADLGYLGQHLCSALRYLHGRGYLHLDIKPGNIISSFGTTRLIDLSLARPPGRVPPGYGTLGYLSPEQTIGGPVGAPTDVWGPGWCSTSALPVSNPSTWMIRTIRAPRCSNDAAIGSPFVDRGFARIAGCPGPWPRPSTPV